MTSSWVVNGGRPLAGEVQISGFKHAALPLVAAGMLASGPFELANVPDVEDVRVIAELLVHAGASARHDRAGRRLLVDPTTISNGTLPSALTRRVHGSLYMVPGLLGKLGEVHAGPFGGCRIGEASAGGERPLEHIREVLQRFGATAEIQGGMLSASCKQLCGCTINMADFAKELSNGGGLTGPLYSGATKAALLCAATAAGVTEIHSPYRKADVADLIGGMIAAGVSIEDRDDVLRVEGRPCLQAFQYEVSSDAIEIVTFFTLAAYLQADIRLTGIADKTWAGLAAELDCFDRMGLTVERLKQSRLSLRADHMNGIDIRVSSHGIFSDSQPFFALLLSGTERGGKIEEHVWVNRFDYASGLTALGAEMHSDGPVLHITPGRAARPGQTVRGNDLRAAATLVLAALGIDGETIIQGVEHLGRGYADLAGQLTSLGASIDQRATS